jgi:hypothetical protein
LDWRVLWQLIFQLDDEAVVSIKLARVLVTGPHVVYHVPELTPPDASHVLLGEEVATLSAMGWLRREWRSEVLVGVEDHLIALKAVIFKVVYSVPLS